MATPYDTGDLNPYAFSYVTNGSTGVAGGALEALRLAGGWPGAQAAPGLKVERELERERARAGPTSVKLPWFLPYFDQGQTVAENAQMRAAYRRMLGDPSVKAAVLQKIISVCALALKVIPAKAPKGDKDLQLKYGREADFLRWSLTEGLEGGVPGMIWSVLSGGLLDGYSLCEKVWAREEKGDWGGLYHVRALKPKDAGNDLILQTDEFRNLVAVQGMRYNGGQYFHPAHFVYYRHLPLFDVATGQSDLRAAYGPWWRRDTVHKLRIVHLERRSGGLLVGHFGPATQRTALEEVLAQARASSWAAVPEDVKLELLDIAGGAAAEYTEAIKDYTHEIFLSIAGAMLQQLEGTTSDGAGNSQVHQSSAELRVWHLSADVEALLNGRHGLARDLIDLNFVTDAYPRVRLAAVDVNEQKAELEVDEKLFNLGVPLSKQSIYDRSGRERPDLDDPDDVLTKDEGGGGGEEGGMPGMPPGPEGGPPPEGPPPDEAPPDEGGGLFDGFAEGEWVPFAAEDWTAYQGAKGGKGWKNTKTGRVVYGDKQPGGGRAPAAKKEPAPKKEPKPKTEKPPPKPKAEKPPKPTVDGVAAAIETARKSGKKATPADVEGLGAAIGSLTDVQVREFRGRMGMLKGGGKEAKNKADRVKGVVDRILSEIGQGEEKPAEGPKEEPKPDPYAIQRVEGKASWDRPAVTYRVGDKTFDSRKEAEAHVTQAKKADADRQKGEAERQGKEAEAAQGEKRTQELKQAVTDFSNDAADRLKAAGFGAAARTLRAKGPFAGGLPDDPAVHAILRDAFGDHPKLTAAGLSIETPSAEKAPPKAGPADPVASLAGEIEDLHARIADPLVTPEDVAAIEAKLDGLSAAQATKLWHDVGGMVRPKGKADALAKIKGRVSGSYKDYRRSLEGGGGADEMRARTEGARAAQKGGTLDEVNADIDAKVAKMEGAELGTVRNHFRVKSTSVRETRAAIAGALKKAAAEAFAARKGRDASAPEPGFTGTDSQGREWKDGELVAKKEEPKAEEKPAPGPKPKKEAKPKLSTVPASGLPRFPPDDAPRALDPAVEESLATQSAAAIGSFSSEERAAVTHYTGGAFRDINAVARGQAPKRMTPKETKKVIASMDAAFAKTPPLKEPITTYRGMSLPKDQETALLAKFAAAAESGEPVSFAGYMSTTLDPGVAAGFEEAEMGAEAMGAVQFEIVARQGLGVHDIVHFQAQQRQERELLLPRDSSFKIHGVREVSIAGKKVRVVQMEQL